MICRIDLWPLVNIRNGCRLSKAFHVSRLRRRESGTVVTLRRFGSFWALVELDDGARYRLPIHWLAPSAVAGAEIGDSTRSELASPAIFFREAP